MTSGPEVTIVMPVRNEAAAIESALADVLAQAEDGRVEVVVADGRSTDGTREILERIAGSDDRVRVVDNPHGGTPQALNAALAAARGRYLIRVDGHSRIPPDYVERILAHLRSERCEGAGGIKRPVGRTPFGRAVAAAWASPFAIGDSPNKGAAEPAYVDHIPFGAYVTERARAIGGWDERFVRNQDAEFDYRYVESGGRLLLDPSIVVDWHVRERPRALARQYYEYGYWRFRTAARHPSLVKARWLAPPAVVAALGAGAALSWTRPGRRLLAAAALPYGAFLVHAGRSLGRELGPGQAPNAVLAVATIHLAWGAGFLASAARSAMKAATRSA